MSRTSQRRRNLRRRVRQQQRLLAGIAQSPSGAAAEEEQQEAAAQEGQPEAEVAAYQEEQPGAEVAAYQEEEQPEAAAYQEEQPGAAAYQEEEEPEAVAYQEEEEPEAAAYQEEQPGAEENLADWCLVYSLLQWLAAAAQPPRDDVQGPMSYREPHYRPESMMLDPATVSARVYVGNLPVNDITKGDMEERFSKHGNVLGVSMNSRGFGFVQFEDEESAADAIKMEHGALFRGKKLDVKAARVYSRPGAGVGGRGRGDDDRGDRDRDNDRDRERPPRDMDRGESFRDRSPVGERDWRANRSRNDDRWPLSSDRDRFDYPRKGSTERDRGNFYGGRERDGQYPPDSYRGPVGRDDRPGGFGKDTYGSSFPEPRGPMPPSVANVDRTNDCEIIVVNKEQREYAEYIEHRLKQLGLTVDLLFPNEEVPVSRVLANISQRGSLYAIVVMPQNEEHRSLTLNILYGQPQEHRNMPIEDAIPLVARNYETYVRGEGKPVPSAVAVVPAVTPGAAAALPERHPEAMQVLLNLLADNRQLTALQYERVIAYLQECREVQLKLELGDTESAPLKTKKQVDLQHRILNILNSSTVGAPAPVPVPVMPPATSGSGSWGGSGHTPLLSDPNVQKALDSLMQGNLLRNITTTQSSTQPTHTPSSSLGTPPSQPLFGAYSSAAASYSSAPSRRY